VERLTSDVAFPHVREVFQLDRHRRAIDGISDVKIEVNT